jgi:hypothetical protein
MGHLPKRIESQDYGSPSKWEQWPKRLDKIILPTRNPKNNNWTRPFTIPQLDQA